MPDIIKLPDHVKKRIESGNQLDLELGCGNRKRHPHAIGIDQLPYDGVDIVGDIEAALSSFPKETIDTVYSYHCFEHLPRIDRIMERLSVIMKPNAKLSVVVPHFSNPYFYSDLTHRQTFGLYSFSYFSHDSLFRRSCPTYQRTIQFKLENVALVFKSPRPFYFRYSIKKGFQFLFNLNRYLMEFYEENLCWMIPCYEIKYDLIRLP